MPPHHLLNKYFYVVHIEFFVPIPRSVQIKRKVSKISTNPENLSLCFQTISADQKDRDNVVTF